MPSTKKLVVTCDSDIEPDDLVPQFLETKARLLELERKGGKSSQEDVDHELAIARLQAKIKRIENDVLFDSFVADQLWKSQRIELEKQLAATKKEAQSHSVDPAPSEETTEEKKSDDGINDEAQRIAAEILAETVDDDGEDLGGLFDSLPQSETDAKTGETRTVISSADGTKAYIRDFGKWSGINPRRALEEACRSRLVSRCQCIQCPLLTLVQRCFCKGLVSHRV